MTGGHGRHKVLKEFNKLPKNIEQQLNDNVILLLDALSNVDDNGAHLPAEAGKIVLRAKAIRDADILKSGQYASLGTMLDTLILNAQNVAIDNDVKTDEW